jgi:hypothetical protein
MPDKGKEIAELVGNTYNIVIVDRTIDFDCHSSLPKFLKPHHT